MAHITTTATSESDAPADAAPQANVRTIFAGLMLGMLLSSLSQTVVSPAMPRIVAELGGMEHYSWIAVSSLLASTVVVPIAGKLSDLFGRKPFYSGGIVLFLVASVIAGFATSFPMLIAARVVQGVGMGTMMPLSQAIIGDIIAPRERGRYQGIMGAVFGVSAIGGPLLGGWITEHLSWRWLFFVNFPVGLLALGFIIPFMHVPHVKRAHVIDYGGFVTLTVGLTTLLLGTIWGGVEQPWSSPLIVGLFLAGVASLVAFVFIESRAQEPVIPLRLWRSSIFTLSNLANMCVAMGMFGVIFYIPVFVQGVLGVGVAGSGALVVPQSAAMILMSIVTGLLITRTGRYKGLLLTGLLLMAAGYFLLTRMGTGTTPGNVVRNIVFVGLGLGMAMQTYTLIVQNAVARDDLGVATATTQLFRSIGSTAGVAILGTIMSSSMAREIRHFLPPEQLAALQAAGEGEMSASALLDPAIATRLPPEVLEGVRTALAAALHPVFLAGLPILAVAFVATMLIREIPLRRTVNANSTDAGQEVLAELGLAGADDEEPVVGTLDPAYRARTETLGLVFGYLSAQALRQDRARLREVVTQLGGGDEERGFYRLNAITRALLHDEAEVVREGVRERGPAAIAQAELEGIDPREELRRALAERPRDLEKRVRHMLREEGTDGEAGLTPDDLAVLERIGIVVSAALLLDVSDAAQGGARDGRGEQAASAPG